MDKRTRKALSKKAQQEAYLNDVKTAASRSSENLEFTLENVGQYVPLEFNLDSLEKVQRLLRQYKYSEILQGLSSFYDLALTVGLFAGQCVAGATLAEWKIHDDKRSPEYGQVVIEGFGNEAWDIFYVFTIARNISNTYEVEGRIESDPFVSQVRSAIRRAGKLERLRQTGP